MIKFLFFDGHELEWVRGFARRPQQATKYGANPVFRADAPWEAGNITLYGSVAKPDGGPFQLWYTTTHVEGGYYLAYAESDDGIHWRRPSFDLYPFDGRPTNLIFRNPHGAAVFLDAEEPREDWRYKMVTGAPPSGCITAFHGADGIHWKRVGAGPVIGTRPDCPMGLLRAADGRYVVYHRTWGYGRRIFRSESWDFRHWSEPKLVLEPDPADGTQVQFYGVGVSLYGPYEVGTLWIYRTEEDDLDLYKMLGLQEPELIYSRSGYAWHRPAQGVPFVPHGGPTEWDSGNLQCASAPVFLPGEIRYYYAGTNVRHKRDWEREKQTSGLGMASLRPDGFVALVAGEEPAELLTTPFILPSTQVRINAVTERNGWIRAALLDADGSPVAGYDDSLPICGDSTEHDVQWPGAAAGEAPAGKLVRIRVRARNAALFSVAVGDAAPYYRFTEGNPARNHLTI